MPLSAAWEQRPLPHQLGRDDTTEMPMCKKNLCHLRTVGDTVGWQPGRLDTTAWLVVKFHFSD
jgi:hypothetical protein